MQSRSSGTQGLSRVLAAKICTLPLSESGFEHPTFRNTQIGTIPSRTENRPHPPKTRGTRGLKWLVDLTLLISSQHELRSDGLALGSMPDVFSPSTPIPVDRIALGNEWHKGPRPVSGSFAPRVFCICKHGTLFPTSLAIGRLMTISGIVLAFWSIKTWPTLVRERVAIACEYRCRPAFRPLILSFTGSHWPSPLVITEILGGCLQPGEGLSVLPLLLLFLLAKRSD